MNFFSLQTGFGGALVIVFQPGAGNPRLDAATKAAVAGRSREFVGVHPGKCGMTPFPGHAVASIQHAAIHGNATAATCPQNHCKHNVLARARAVRGFRNSQAVGVIRAAHLAM